MITVEDVSFRYAGRTEPSVREVSFHVPRGECVLLTGRTGCGKSTLLKMLGGIIPHESAGEMQGRVIVNGMDTRASSLPSISQYVGMVFQSPDDQIFCTTVKDEVSFGPENLGLPRAVITERVRDALARVGLGGFEERLTTMLSGGQKQRVAIASQLAMGPVVLVLDEPVSQLDPSGTAAIVECLGELKQRGITIVLVEHRVDEVIGIADRVMVMEQGRIVLDIDREDLPAHTGVFETLGLKVPDAVRIAGAVCPGCPGNRPGGRTGVFGTLGLKVPDAVRTAGAVCPGCPGNRPGGPAVGGAAEGPPGGVLRHVQSRGNNGIGGGYLLSLDEVSFSYPGAGEPSLEEISLEIQRGDIIAVMGRNGSGKSTLLSILSGIIRPASGAVKTAPGARRAGMVFQNPDLQLFEDSVWAELEFSPKNLGADRETRARRNRTLLRMLRLEGLEAIPPHALSRGQRLRVVTGAVLAMEPRLLLLDEPTTGQNEENIRNLVRTVRNEPAIEAVVFCTHDFETAVRFANRVLLMREGRIIADGPAREVLADRESIEEAGLLPPLAFILSRKSGIHPPALTVEEFIGAVHGVS